MGQQRLVRNSRNARVAIEFAHGIYVCGIDIRPRKLWKSKISRTPENALHFHEGLPPRSRCLFISDLAHKLMATFNFAPTSGQQKHLYRNNASN